MLKLILVPLDGSPFGEQAIPLAILIAERQRAEIELIHVHDSFPPYRTMGAPPIDPGLDEALRKDRISYLEAVAKWLRQATSAPVTSTVLDSEAVSEALITHINERHADLVVIATHGRSGLTRLWLGSVASDLVRHSPAPVLLFHPDEKGSRALPARPFRRVLVPLDGTPEYDEAIDHALAVAGDVGAEFHLMQVIVPVVYYAEPAPVAFFDQSALEDLAREYLAGVANRIRSRGFTATTAVIVNVSPARAILDEAEERKADLIAMETHGRTGLARLLMGSVSDKVARAATVPVLVHRPHVDAEFAGQQAMERGTVVSR
jgi:nucleotide-binding universal stress UspA family protein